MDQGTRWIVCSMCGFRFNPDQQEVCQSCPLQRGCQLVRCPQCGFEMTDPERSTLARLAKRWLFTTKSSKTKNLA
ncbi:MAG: hypothetical protein QME21_06510 [Anaerolineales bacterium]|nr:hypothetical protein [Anaerolineales bacterium]